jgi:hypothetical protein
VAGSISGRGRHVGLDRDALSFILAGRASGVSFEHSATLGRQETVLSRRQLRALYAALGLPPRRSSPVFRGWADPILHDLGAREVVSIDASAYEGATYLYDLNRELPDDLVGRFTMVLDGGTLEHIFDFPTAIGNCMRMVKLHGHLLLVTPTNNESGHGFYQFSPELFHRALAPEYGFRIERMLLREHAVWPKRWYEVADPGAVGGRAQYRSRSVAYLYVRARRIGPVAPFDPPPQQSDYVARWNDEWRPPAERAGMASVRRVIGEVAPELKRRYLQVRPRTRSWYQRPDYRRLPTHFRRVADPIAAAARVTSPDEPS